MLLEQSIERWKSKVKYFSQYANSSICYCRGLQYSVSAAGPVAARPNGGTAKMEGPANSLDPRTYNYKQLSFMRSSHVVS